MKYGDELTAKLEEIAMSKQKFPKEWEYFKEQVLHSFMTAEKIGNRNVNREEHENWENRLIKLGILERKLEKEADQKQKFLDSIKYNPLSKDNSDNNKDRSQQLVSLESALQKNAEQMYLNTGMVPVGYKKDKNGIITRIQPTISVDDKRVNRLSATRNVNQSNENKKTSQQLSR